MLAYIDAVRLVKRTFHLLGSCRCGGGEYLLQRLFPGLQRFLCIDLHIAVSEAALGYLTDYGIGYAKLSHLICGNLRYDIAEACGKQVSLIYAVLNLNAQLITKGHLADSGCQTGTVQSVSGNNPSCLYVLEEAAIQALDLLIIRQFVSVSVNLNQNQLIACFFQLRRNDGLIAGHIHCKGYQCGRYVDLIEGTGHTVLSSDGGQSEAQLRAVRAKERCKGLAPAMRILGHSAEVLLEAETDLAVIAACRHDSRHGLNDCVNSAMIGAPAGQVRIEAIAHHGYHVGLAFQHRKLCHHGLGLGQLIFAAVRHQDAACADGAVEHLHQALLGAYV